MLLSTLVNGKGKFLLGLAEQFRLILLHDVEVVPLYLQQSCPQVAFKHKLNPLKFHLQYIDVESIICVATSSLGLFCYDFLLPQDHLLHLFHQSLLEGQQLRRHLLIMQKLGYLWNLLSNGEVSILIGILQCKVHRLCICMLGKEAALYLFILVYIITITSHPIPFYKQICFYHVLILIVYF